MSNLEGHRLSFGITTFPLEIQGIEAFILSLENAKLRNGERRAMPRKKGLVLAAFGL